MNNEYIKIMLRGLTISIIVITGGLLIETSNPFSIFIFAGIVTYIVCKLIKL